MELIMILREHKQIVAGLSETADQLERVADATARVTEENDRATMSYLRMRQAAQDFQPPSRLGFHRGPTDYSEYPGEGRFRRPQAERPYFVRKAEEAQQPALAARFAGAIWNSRYGGSRTALGGAAPMAGQALRALGVSPAQLTAMLANPWVSAGALVTSASVALYRAMDDAAGAAATYARNDRNLQFQTGGTPRERAELQGLGISPGTSRALADRIGSDPYAAMQAQRFGVSQIPGPNGTLNNARNTLKIVSELRRLKGESQLHSARRLGVDGDPEIQRALRMSDDQFNRLRRDAESGGRFNTEAADREGADYEASKNRASESRSRQWTYIGRHFTRPMTGINNWAAEANNRQVEGLESRDPAEYLDFAFDRVSPISGLSRFARKTAIGWTGKAQEVDSYTRHREALNMWAERERLRDVSPEQWDKDQSKFEADWKVREGGGSGITAEEKAKLLSEQSRNSDELAKNTAALAYLTRAMGGGERAGRALPSSTSSEQGRGKGLLHAYEHRSLKNGVL